MTRAAQLAFATALLLAWSGLSLAADLFNGYFLPPEKSSLGSTFIECQLPAKNGEMTCSFTDIDIRHKIPTKVSAAERASLAKELFADPNGICAAIPAADANSPASSLRAQNAFRKVCAHQDAATIAEFFDATDAMEAATCKIGTMGTYQTKFHLQAETATAQSWVATNGPGGSCGVVTVESLEMDKTKQLDWTYRKQQNVTRPSGNEQCGSLRTSPQVYRWLSESRPAKCDFVQFQPTFLP